jgi:hypothetical protein
VDDAKPGLKVPLLKLIVDRVETASNGVLTVTSPVIAKPVPA